MRIDLEIENAGTVARVTIEADTTANPLDVAKLAVDTINEIDRLENLPSVSDLLMPVTPPRQR